MRTLSILIAALVAASPLAAQDEPTPFKQIELASIDGLKVTGELYVKHAPEAPFMVLCHQAGWSRGEYREIAPRLVAMGFNCLAIDQRSGGKVGDVDNQTFARAKAAGNGTTYLDARQDIVAALRFVRKAHARGKLIAVGSSYSSALVLEIVGSDAALADGVISFAPGEYFQRLGKSATFVRDGAARLTCPVFVTSSRAEARQWKAIFEAIASKAKTGFLPETRGNHGARALWKQFDDSPTYWKALTAFLDEHFPRAPKAAD